MSETRDARARIVTAVMAGREASASDARVLRDARDALAAVPPASRGRTRGTARVVTDRGRPLVVDLSSEIAELDKDLALLESGERGLLALLARLHESFAQELEGCSELLASAPPLSTCFVADRDGTLNAYSGRYRTSVQGAYNALLLSRFARRSCRRALILTSAPLGAGGLLEVSVLPPGLFALAGSKGREALDEEGRLHRMPLAAGQQRVLEELNVRLAALLERPEHEVFGLIGSGLQVKLGQSAIAYQDVHGSVGEPESRRFREAVFGAIEAVDPRGESLSIEDTGRDLEIGLVVSDSGGAARGFDKGDGLRYLDAELRLGLERGSVLVCGDTESDLPMLEAAVRIAGEDGTRSVFVTREEALKEKVRARAPRSCFVGSPDALVAALGGIGGPALP